MLDRSQSLKKIRSDIRKTTIRESMSDEERFQNLTLRPILKLQNELLLAFFQNYIQKRKNAFYEMNLDKRMDYISHSVQKDSKLRNSLKGIIIGHFTLEEYREYKENSSALNKRMMNLIIKRLQDQIQYFDKKALLVE